MLISDALKIATQRLAEAGCETPRLDAEVLLAHALKQERSWLYTHPSAVIEPKQREHFTDLLIRRARREPVAYIIGHKAFFGLEFLVNRHVLIPRSETELLVEIVISYQLPVISNQLSVISDQLSVTSNQLSVTSDQSLISNLQSPMTIADIGTGSGCISIALAKHLAGATFDAVDCSAEALQVAQANAVRHGVADRISFFQGNLLAPLPGLFDVIISNPPYINHTDLAEVMPEVRHYEPQVALDGGIDGLQIIRRLLPQAKEKLKPDGKLLIEIGADQGKTILDLARTYFSRAKVYLKKDLAGLDRVLVVEQLSG